MLSLHECEKSILPTEWGDFVFYVWPAVNGKEPTALCTKGLKTDEIVTLRIHSECLTGDTFSSLNCDCGYQKAFSLDLIQKNGNGIFIYDRQEGRGIGLYNKIKALNLQKQGYDTYIANEMLGFRDDERTYKIPIEILKALNISRVRLITNNPRKIQILSDAGIEVVKRIAVCKTFDSYNEKYLMEKAIIGKHMIGEM